MSDKLELKVIFNAVDNFIRPVKAITEGAKAASKALKENQDRLSELNGTMSKIDAFERVRRDAAIAANTLKSTQNKIAALREEMQKTGATEKMTKELSRLQEKAKTLPADIEKLRRNEYDLSVALKMASVDTSKLSDARQHLTAASAAAAMSSRKLQSELDAENKKMQRVHAAQAALNKTRALRDKVAGAGAGLTAGGVAVGLPVAKVTKDYADFETAMLGVARQVDGARDANGKLTATYYEIGTAVKALSERLPLTANEIAKIVEGGARMGITGKENLLTFTELTAVMASAFDLPVDKVGEDIGKISQLYKVPIKDIKELGDTINWLDDNALSKGGDIIDVMKRIAGTADMVKMNFREAAALGSTFLSLGAAPEVAATASNAMMRELSIATMGSKRFMAGLDMLKLKAKDVQLGMNKDATGTIIKVLEAIKALPEEKQLEAATRLFGKEYGDDAAKLASNLDEYRRQLQLVNDEKARGSMGRENSARNDTLNARMAMAKNALTNISSDFGEHLKPALVATMERTLGVLQAIRAWSAENPQLAAGIITVVKWLAVGLTVIGGLTLAAAAVLGPLALLKFSVTTLGISGAALGGTLGTVLGYLLAIPAAFTAGYVAGGYLNDLLNKLLSSLAGYQTTLGGLIFDLVEKFKNTSWSDIGGYIIHGIEAGLDIATAGLYGKVKAIALGLTDTVKSALGIHSPSRVFAQLGAFTMQGLEQGLAGGENGPLSAVGDMAKKLASIGAGVAIGGAAMADNIRLDNRPPISPAAMFGAMAGGGNTYNYNITITAAPGTDNQGLAAMVGREIERIESQRAAQRRSRLRDSE